MNNVFYLLNKRENYKTVYISKNVDGWVGEYSDESSMPKKYTGVYYTVYDRKFGWFDTKEEAIGFIESAKYATKKYRM